MKFVKKAAAALAALLMLAAIAPTASLASDELITDYATLITAVRDASDGDTLLVGDIDLRPTSPSVAYSYMSVRADADITIKSGKKGGEAAVLLNAGFVLAGSKTSGEKLTIRFENIVFDGCAEQDALTAADFEYPYSESLQEYTTYAPEKAQQAFACEGSVDASFVGCTFRNYMHEYGPVLDLRYADYTGNEYITLPDYSGCAVNFSFEDCTIANNSALYDGGAIYVESNNNVSLRFDRCTIGSNRSGGGNFKRGGGFVYADSASLEFVGCTLSDNLGNHIYDGVELPDTDQLRGGALCLSNGSLSMTDCELTGNRCSMGGALSLTNMRAELDGCRFSENRAEAFATDPYGTTGPWSNMAQGGAIYVEGTNNETVSLINCEIENNSAATAYGGIHAFFSLIDQPSDPAYHLKLSLCSIAGNSVDSSYEYPVEDTWLWFSHPGDFATNFHVEMFGCYIVDDIYAADFPRSDSPTADNGYNYISSVADEEALKTRIPSDAAQPIVGERYDGELSRPHVGSNYDAELYESGSSSGSTVAIFASLLCSGSALTAVLASRRRRRSQPQPAEGEAASADVEAAPARVVVKVRYTDAEIDKFISLTPECATLTSRELEVLRELLLGRKQSEVAYRLGIEVTTVKDFCKKIYSKLNVSNKDALFHKAAELLAE